MKSTWLRNEVGCFLCLATFFGILSSASAATLTVGAGGAAPNYLTISNAVAAASDGDVIQIVTNVQTECGIVITKSLTIQGQGMNNTILQGAASRSNATSRIFRLNNAAKTLNIQNMTLQYGYIAAGSGYGGGAILNSAGTVTVQNCVFTMNDAFAQNGSGYYVGGGAIAQPQATDPSYTSLSISNSVFVNNSASGTNTTGAVGGGGAIFAGCSVTIDSCSFVSNSANAFGGATTASGGAIQTSSLRDLTVRNSTFFGNSCSNNASSTGKGGAIYLPNGAEIVNLYNCTFVSNVSGSAYAGAVSYAGSAGGGYLNVYSTIFVGNAPYEIYGAAPDGSNVLSSCLLQGGSAHVTNINCITASNPLLQPLAYNGGPTPTMALQAGSPCVNHGINPLGLSYDQRGTGYTRVMGSAADIGAFEYGAGPTSLVYSVRGFSEQMPLNNGSIDNSTPMIITITNDTFSTLTNDTFAGTDGSDISSHVVVSNLPAGLAVSMIRTNGGRRVMVILTGQATSSAEMNSATNLAFAFQDSAFNSGKAGTIGGSSRADLAVTFFDAGGGGSLSYSATNFIEDAVYNDGRIDYSAPLVITVTNDNFTGASSDVFGSDKVVVANLPVGLTSLVTWTSSKTLAVTLTGRALAHAASNSIATLGFTFQNSAFLSGNAAVIAGSVTNLGVTFLDPATNVSLVYNGSVFVESGANDGGMGNTISITLSNDIFNGNNGDDFVAAGRVLASNVPAGLTAVVQRVDMTHVSASLTGKALAHNSANNVSGLGLVFQNTAFYNTPALSVTNAVRSDLQIAFLDPALTYSGTNFVEYWQNDGSMGNTLTLTLVGDTFAGTNGENFAANGKVTAGNVPGGLTASVVRQAAGQVVFGLFGNASTNNIANSISNLSLTFNDAAFTMGGSALVTNGSRNNLLVTFVGSTAPSNFWVSVSGNNTTGNGTAGNPWRSIQYALNSSAVRADAYDVINVMAGTYDETNILNGYKAVAINGAGKDQTIVEAGSVYNAVPFDSHVFYLSGNGVTLRDMTIRYGNVTNFMTGSGVFLTGGDLILERCRVVSNTCYSAAGSYNGGSVFLSPATTGTLTLKSCEVIGNTSFNGGVAGVNVPSLTALVLTNCVVANNVSAYGGGAINVGGSSLVMWDSLVTNNVVMVAGQPGGGIYVGNATCTSLIERCTFAWNQSPSSGGGLYLNGTNVLVNSTVYGNTVASGNGGGVAINAGYTRFYNSTIAGNTAGNGLGGGLYNAYGTWSAASTLVAGNTASNSLDIGYGSYAPVDDHCFIGNNTNSGVTAGQPNGNGSYVGTGASPLNPQLLPLANNGGLTPTCAIQSGSLCRDHGNNLIGLVNDQRDESKYPRQYGVATDIGAYEFVPVGGTMLIVQ